jgi:hypothetical protein
MSGEAPSTNHQITNKLQKSNPKSQTKIVWVIGYWTLFGLWDLSFGIYDSRPCWLPAMPG